MKKEVAVLAKDGAFALLFRPLPRGFDSSRVPTTGNLPSKAKKMLMVRGSARGGGGRWAQMELADALCLCCGLLLCSSPKVRTGSVFPGVSWCCGNYCWLAFVLWCGYCSVSFQSFVLRHWCPQHQETTVFPAFCHTTFRHALIPCCNVSRGGTIAQMYPDRDTFDFSQGHVTKNQPMTVPV